MSIITAGTNQFASDWATAINGAFEGLIKVQSTDGNVVFVDAWDDLLDTLTLQSGDTITVYPGKYTATQRGSSDNRFYQLDNLTIVGIGNPTITATITGSTGSQAGFFFDECDYLYVKGITFRIIVDSTFTGGTEAYGFYVRGNLDGTDDCFGNVIEDCMISETWNAVADGAEMIVALHSEEMIFRNCRFSAFNLAGGNLVKFFSTHDALAVVCDGCIFVSDENIDLHTGGTNPTPVMTNCINCGACKIEIPQGTYETAKLATPPEDWATLDGSWFNESGAEWEFAHIRGTDAVSPSGTIDKVYEFVDGITTNITADITGRRGSSTLLVRVPIFWATGTAGDVTVRAVTYVYPLDGSARQSFSTTGVNVSANESADTVTYVDLEISVTDTYIADNKVTLIVQRQGGNTGDTFAESAYFFTPEYKWVDEAS